MALRTPTIQEITDGIINDIESELNQTIPVLKKNVFRVISSALAGAWQLLYKYGNWNLQQIFPQTASEKYLELLGENKKILRQSAAAWSGTLKIAYTSGTYRDIEAGEQLINEQSQIIYVVTNTVPISTSPYQSFDVKSTVASENSQLTTDQELTFLNSSELPTKTAIYDTTTTTSADIEDLEIYRQRVIEAYQKQPQGGALVDYEQWAEETAHVINAYPYSSTNPTEVVVYIEVDNETDGIPTTTQKAECLQLITYDPITNLQTRKPLTDDVTVKSITRTGFDVTITGLSPDNSDIRTSIQNAVVGYFLNTEPYILGLSIDRKDKITIGAVTAAASIAASVESATFTTLALFKSATPVVSYDLGSGEKSKLNPPITWS